MLNRSIRPTRHWRKLTLPERLESRCLLAADPLAVLNDEFENSATLSDWNRINQVEGWNADQLAVWDIDNTQDGRMVLAPHTVVWYNSWRGPLVFKEVTGDFVFTTQVHITDRDDVGNSDADDVPNDSQYSLGGVMIRTPRAISNPATDWTAGSMQNDGTNNGENYVFLSMGHGTNGNMTFEVKTTRNSSSSLTLTPVNANTSTLQIARIGNTVLTMLHVPGQDWVVHRRFSRPDMPQTLQVGLVSYTNWEKANDFDPFFHNGHVLTPSLPQNPTPGEPYDPDIIAGFDYARFSTPEVPAALQGVNLFNNASDAELLSFLGDNANAPSEVGELTAGDDTFTVLSNSPTTLLPILLNDSTPSGNAPSIVAVGPPSEGGNALASFGQIQYTPPSGFQGTETFTYTINDGSGPQSSATVTVNVSRQWHNQANPVDVDGDSELTVVDAVVLINVLLSQGEFTLPPTAGNLPEMYLDPTGDGELTVVDALLVISELLLGGAPSPAPVPDGEAIGASTKGAVPNELPDELLWATFGIMESSEEKSTESRDVADEVFVPDDEESEAFDFAEFAKSEPDSWEAILLPPEEASNPLETDLDGLFSNEQLC